MPNTVAEAAPYIGLLRLGRPKTLRALARLRKLNAVTASPPAAVRRAQANITFDERLPSRPCRGTLAALNKVRSTALAPASRPSA